MLSSSGTLEGVYAHLDEINPRSDGATQGARGHRAAVEQWRRRHRGAGRARAELMGRGLYCVPVDHIEALFPEWEFGSLIRSERAERGHGAC